MIPLSSFVKPSKSKDFGSPNGTMVWTVSEKERYYIDFFFAYHVMEIISYIILIILRNINITVPRFYDVNHGKFIILICLD